MADRTLIATQFLQQSAAGEVEAAFRAVTPGFRHHNPHFAGDAGSLKSAMLENHWQNPGKEYVVQRTIAEGNLVAVHGKVSLAPERPAVAVVHLFRFEGESIAELWDVGQVAPAESPNVNGMF